MREIKRRPKFKRNISRQYAKERTISPGLQIKIWFSDVMVIIGGVFVLMGLPFVLIFAPLSSIFSPGFENTDPLIEGKIVEVNGTSSYVNDVRVYEYIYAYMPPDGGNYQGIGYSTGSVFEIDQQIQIQYKRNQQEVSKAKKLRLNSFPAGIGFIVFIFPLIGAVLFYFGAKKAINAIRILKIGEIAYGKFLHKEATNTTVNKQRVYKLTFEFTAKDNVVYQTVAKTHHYHLLEDDETEKLVYDPDDPENAVLLDALPKAVADFFENE